MKIILGLLAVPPLLGLSLWAAAAASSPLAVFNALVPVDSGVTRLAEGEAYGPDPRQRLDVYAPKAPTGASGPLPVLVFCYGGGWYEGDRSLYDFAGRAFAAAGFLTIVFDYRLVPEVRFPDFVDDTAAAIAWASRNANRYGGDGATVYLVGHSAGAYNVAMAALDPRFLAAHGLNRSVIGGVATLAGPFDFLPLSGRAAVGAFGQWPVPAQTQPINYVSPGAPPFLLIAGNKDRTVSPRNSQRLADRLRAVGTEAKLVTLEGLGHADVLTVIARPLRWRAPVLSEITGFFRSLQAREKRSSIAS
ncbi:alpha/beta hydrolase [Aestuariivirga sp.]|uniref:alpha/beta hydrolase n=1 Tax=Aestuariivirga sp. TaxID=2650926 RepID=UPI003BAABC93